MTPAITHAMSDALGGRAPVVDIPLAGHHLMLDQPLSLVTAIRTVLAGWSRPAAGRGLSPATEEADE